MRHDLYRTIVAGCCLAAASLAASTIWDSWYYSQNRRGASVARPLHADPRPRQAPRKVGGAPPPGRLDAARDPGLVLVMAGIAGAPPAAESRRSAVAPVPAMAPPRPAPERQIEEPAPIVAAPPARRSIPVDPEPVDAGEERPMPPPQNQPPRTDPTAAAPGDPIQPLALLPLLPAPAEPEIPAEPRPDPPSDQASPPDPSPDPPPAPGPPAESPAGITRVAMIPSDADPAPGDVVTVRVVLTEGAGITSLPFHVMFDPQVLEYIGARQGSLFAATSRQPILLAAVSESRPGDLAVGLSMLRDVGVISGSGAVVALEFRAVAPGPSDLQFDRASMRSPTGRTLQADFVDAAVTVR